MRISFNYVLWTLFGFFLCAALYFTVSVEKFKGRLNTSSESISFASGQKATVIKIIDGDEISVKFNNSQFVVRILGISSYEPAVNDPVMENVARDTIRYLERELLNSEVELVFENFQKDKDNRVLSYVYHNKKDVGLFMIENGLSIVFTRYVFPRIDEYLAAERKAVRGKAGLWGVPAAAKRSMMLKNLWKKENAN